jgi:hypothetical protein
MIQDYRAKLAMMNRRDLHTLAGALLALATRGDAPESFRTTAESLFDACSLEVERLQQIERVRCNSGPEMEATARRIASERGLRMRSSSGWDYHSSRWCSWIALIDNDTREEIVRVIWKR